MGDSKPGINQGFDFVFGFGLDPATQAVSRGLADAHLSG